MIDADRASAHTSADDPDYWEALIPEAEAARFLGVSVRAMQNWRVRGGGPPFVRISGRCIRYRRRDLAAWSEAKRQDHTSAPPVQPVARTPKTEQEATTASQVASAEAAPSAAGDELVPKRGEKRRRLHTLFPHERR